jgi:hypothetical protein
LLSTMRPEFLQLHVISDGSTFAKINKNADINQLASSFSSKELL